MYIYIAAVETTLTVERQVVGLFLKNKIVTNLISMNDIASGLINPSQRQEFTALFSFYF